MAVTTLIPTVIHLLAGLAALVTRKSRMTARVGRRLRELRDDPAMPVFSKVELAQRVGELRVAWALGPFLGTILAMLVGPLLWDVGYRVWSMLT
jgi:hypothetical protein